MMGVKNKIAMISLSALLFNANHMSGMETIKRVYTKMPARKCKKFGLNPA